MCRVQRIDLPALRLGGHDGAEDAHAELGTFRQSVYELGRVIRLADSSSIMRKIDKTWIEKEREGGVCV